MIIHFIHKTMHYEFMYNLNNDHRMAIKKDLIKKRMSLLLIGLDLDTPEG